jgi:hypothetical protein
MLRITIAEPRKSMEAIVDFRIPVGIQGRGHSFGCLAVQQEVHRRDGLNVAHVPRIKQPRCPVRGG